MKVVRTIEWLFLSLGVLLVVSYLTARFHRAVSSREAVRGFDALQQSQRARADRQTGKPSLPLPETIDFSLWSRKRIFEYHISLTQCSAAPLRTDQN